MKTWVLMGMPIRLEIVANAPESLYQQVYQFLSDVDDQFSTYKKDSEISKINRGEITEFSARMREVLDICEQTKRETNGYFDIEHQGILDPSGVVKGWALKNASEIIMANKYWSFYLEAGGDIQTMGQSNREEKWAVGIKHPFELNKIVKVLHLSGEGVATSAEYERGQHIYNPKGHQQREIVSVTVIAKDVLEADRFATAVFAMGRDGIKFLEQTSGLEGYMIDNEGIGTSTSGLEMYL